jgi:hypothetical protein
MKADNDNLRGEVDVCSGRGHGVKGTSGPKTRCSGFPSGDDFDFCRISEDSEKLSGTVTAAVLFSHHGSQCNRTDQAVGLETS